MEKMMKQKKIWIAAAGVALLAVFVVVLAAMRGGKEPSYRSIKIVELAGEVSIDRGGVGTLAAAENMNLVSGDRVATAEKAYVVLCLDTDKYVMLGEAGAMTIVAEGDGNSGKTSISLESGSVLNEIRNPLSEGSSYEIATPNATMSVRGTVFEVENEGDGQVSVLVYDGRVAVEMGEEEPVLYNAGEYTVFTDSAAPKVLVERGTISDDVIDEKVRERLQQISTEGRPLNVGSADLSAAVEANSVPVATPEATEVPAATEAPAMTATSAPAEAVTATPAATEIPVVTATPAATAAPTVAATSTATATQTATPMVRVTPAPTVVVTPAPTATPIVTATPAPTVTPMVTAVPAVTEAPVPEPEEDEEEPEPAVEPTAVPTKEPEPTIEPTAAPTKEPEPTVEPTAAPTEEPEPTAAPTKEPEPTIEPTAAPTKEPEPTVEPTAAPTKEPEPTVEPTAAPTKEPEPTVKPTPIPWPTFGPWWPTAAPTTEPTAEPTIAPTTEPTAAPTAEPTVAPTTEPTAAPTAEPTVAPTTEPTAAPTAEPTIAPTTEPTTAPTAEPTVAPTTEPTAAPTATPAPPQEGYCQISYEVPYVLISGKEPENDDEAAGILTALAYGSSTVKKGELLLWEQSKVEVTSIPNHGDVQGLGFEFVGWYKANGFEWIFATDVAMEDTVLYPVWKDKDGNLYKVKVSEELGVCYSIKVSDGM